jgi:hypothetical protein
MIEVAAILKKSSSASQFTQQIQDLSSWVQEILNGTFAARVRVFLFVWLQVLTSPHRI